MEGLTLNTRVAPKSSDRPRLKDVLGPGLITGASDDDPSGIATYSQAGAQFGYALGWTLLLTYPLMCAIQMISARVGRVTGHGLAENMRRHYPAPVLYTLVGLLLVANTINLGADLGAMAAALGLLVPGPAALYVGGFAIVTVVLEVFTSYQRYASVLRWLTLSLFAYVATVFVVGVPWLTVARNLVLPHLEFSGAYLTVVVAVFGTTISPYLFFWQASEEVEEEKDDPDAKPLVKAPEQAPSQLARIQLDTLVGMGISNVIALFIILTTAATLNAHGIKDIQTSSQAAEALRPIAGEFAFVVFALGIVGTGYARRAGARRQRRLCRRRSAALAGRTVAEAETREGLLRRHRRRDADRRRPQLQSARSDQGAVLERGHQRRRGGADHDHDHALEHPPGRHAPVHARPGPEGFRLAGDGGHGRCRGRHVCDLGRLRLKPACVHHNCLRVKRTVCELGSPAGLATTRS